MHFKSAASIMQNHFDTRKVNEKYQDKTIKCCIALFICLATKAIHKELAISPLVSMYLDDSFLEEDAFVLKTDVYSDSDSNFVSAKRELNKSYTGHILVVV